MTHRTRTAALLLAAVAVATYGLGAPAQAKTTGGVKGVVSLNGAPLKGMTVQLYLDVDSDPGGDGDDLHYGRIATDTTNSKGAYSFSGLTLKKDPTYGIETHRYLVRITDPAGTVVRTERPFKPRVGPAVTVNPHMRRAVSLFGTVAPSSSGHRIRVTIDGTNGRLSGHDDVPGPEIFDDSKLAAPDGTFRFVGMPAGRFYSITFTDPSGAYLAQCYDNTLATDGCEGFDLAPGQSKDLGTQTLTHPVP